MNSLFQALNNTADGAFVIDSSQRIVHWNAAAQAMLGFSADEVIGRSCYEIIRGRDDDDRAWCRGNCLVTSSVHAGKTVESFNTCARSKNGDLRWINVSILAAPQAEDESGPLVVHLFRDAMEQKQQERFARQVLGMVQDMQWGSKPIFEASSIETPAANLTERELDVLMLLARGLSTADIAQSLSISSSTTRNHIQNIFQKLGVHSRSAAVAWAFEQGLVTSE